MSRAICIEPQNIAVARKAITKTLTIRIGQYFEHELSAEICIRVEPSGGPLRDAFVAQVNGQPWRQVYVVVDMVPTIFVRDLRKDTPCMFMTAPLRKTNAPSSHGRRRAESDASTLRSDAFPDRDLPRDL